jgi:hypothetical protein
MYMLVELVKANGIPHGKEQLVFLEGVCLDLIVLLGVLSAILSHIPGIKKAGCAILRDG